MDEQIIEWTDCGGTRRRYRFVERLETDDWWRIEEEHQSVCWREVGREPVSDVVMDG